MVCFRSHRCLKENVLSIKIHKINKNQIFQDRLFKWVRVSHRFISQTETTGKLATGEISGLQGKHSHQNNRWYMIQLTTPEQNRNRHYPAYLSGNISKIIFENIFCTLQR